MFQQLRSEALSRLTDVDRFCRQTCLPDGDRMAAVGKGLAFVNMYAAYEYCVRSTVQAGILSINAHAIPHCEVRWELLGITLHPEIQSLSEPKNSKMWQSRLQLFQRLFSTTAAVASESVLPGASDHFRSAQLQLIWQFFGLPEPILPTERLVGFVDFELVEHRNAVAHGRVTAYDVGKAYTAADIFERVQFTQEISLHIILTMEQHCSDATNARKPPAAG